MKTIFLILFSCLLAIVQPATAQWKDSVSGTRLPETEWRKSVAGLGVSMVLTGDVREFVTEWRSTTESHRPAIRTTEKAVRGDTLGVVFFLAQNEDCAGEFAPSISCTIYRPDGEVYVDLPAVSAWSGEPLKPEVMYLSDTLVLIDIEADDPFGEYEIQALFKQNNNAEPIKLEQSFEVVESEPVPDFESRFEKYYLDPDPDWIEEAIAYAGTAGIFERQHAVVPTLAFFVEVFAQNPDRMQEWQEVIDRQPAVAKTALSQAVKSASENVRLLDNESRSPTLNDAYWGAFYASGDRRYLARLIRNLSDMDERDDQVLFMTAATAKWSLASNAQRHPIVREAVEEALEEAEGRPVAEELRDILVLTPGFIEYKINEIVRTQYNAGRWR